MEERKEWKQGGGELLMSQDVAGTCEGSKQDYCGSHAEHRSTGRRELWETCGVIITVQVSDAHDLGRVVRCAQALGIPQRKTARL